MTATVSAHEVIERFQHSAPVDVAGIAEALGLNLWESDDLPLHISGKLFKDPENGGTEGFSIIVRASDPYVRRRFTAAHEIAHFVLHRNRIGDSISDDEWYRSGLSSPEEIEANRFAARILMPTHLVKKYADVYDFNLSRLARQFEVSEEAMSIRLKGL